MGAQCTDLILLTAHTLLSCQTIEGYGRGYKPTLEAWGQFANMTTSQVVMNFDRKEKAGNKKKKEQRRSSGYPNKMSLKKNTAAPVVTNMNPLKVPTNGSVVTIFGQNFGIVNSSATISVAIGGFACSDPTVVVSHTQIVCYLNPGTGGNLPVYVTVQGQTNSNTYLASYYAPTLVSRGEAFVLPFEGVYFVLNGYNFGPTQSLISVAIDGISCLSVDLLVPHLQVQCKIPYIVGSNMPVTMVVNGLSNIGAVNMSYDCKIARLLFLFSCAPPSLPLCPPFFFKNFEGANYKKINKNEHSPGASAILLHLFRFSRLYHGSFQYARRYPGNDDGLFLLRCISTLFCSFVRSRPAMHLGKCLHAQHRARIDWNGFYRGLALFPKQSSEEHELSFGCIGRVLLLHIAAK